MFKYIMPYLTIQINNTFISKKSAVVKHPVANGFDGLQEHHCHQSRVALEHSSHKL